MTPHAIHNKRRRFPSRLWTTGLTDLHLGRQGAFTALAAPWWVFHGEGNIDRCGGGRRPARTARIDGHGQYDAAPCRPAPVRTPDREVSAA